MCTWCVFVGDYELYLMKFQFLLITCEAMFMFKVDWFCSHFVLFTLCCLFLLLEYMDSFTYRELSELVLWWCDDIYFCGFWVWGNQMKFFKIFCEQIFGKHLSCIIWRALCFCYLGGKKFCTTIDTLTQREPDSMLAAMFSGRHTICQDTDTVQQQQEMHSQALFCFIILSSNLSIEKRCLTDR